MPVYVRVGVPADETAAGAAEVLRTRATKKTSAAVKKDIARHMLLATDDRFREEEAPDGEPWAPLSPVTKKAKRTSKILQESGNSGGLRDSITYEVLPDGVRIGTPKFYGRVHQLGIGERSALSTKQRMPAIPARPFLGVSAADLDEIESIITRGFTEEGE